MKKKILALSMLVVLFLSTGNCLFAQTQIEKPFSVKVTGKGEPMLFIPGLTCSGTVWDATIAKYSKNYQCHVFRLQVTQGSPQLETHLI